MGRCQCVPVLTLLLRASQKAWGHNEEEKACSHHDRLDWLWMTFCTFSVSIGKEEIHPPSTRWHRLCPSHLVSFGFQQGRHRASFGTMPILIPDPHKDPGGFHVQVPLYPNNNKASQVSNVGLTCGVVGSRQSVNIYQQKPWAAQCSDHQCLKRLP